MTIREMQAELRRRLAPVVGSGEADAMSKIILEETKGYTPVDLVVHSERELLPPTIERIRGIAARVENGEPLQYVLGIAWWRGRRFAVNPSVLIPRPETSQLADMIVDENRHRSDLAVLDIGTGSGCIAVSLALDLPFAKVQAIDISRGALDTAVANAAGLKAKVEFTQADVFRISDTSLSEEKFDIIVSNPPYVLESERAGVESIVKDHEPSKALFVEDAHSIDIYRAIIDYASTNLNAGGRLYLELNPLCATAVKKYIEGCGLLDAEIIRDYKGTERFATATHP